ncbi:MAG: hypothetical protein HC767_00800 [Akkermansiaceae bacterium]|nr:hypothetical protein [Akkermansiaceae bacterium]
MQGTYDPAMMESEHGTNTADNGQSPAMQRGNASSEEPQLLFRDLWAQRLQLEESSSLAQAKLYARKWNDVEASATALMNALEGMSSYISAMSLSVLYETP